MKKQIYFVDREKQNNKKNENPKICIFNII